MLGLLSERDMYGYEIIQRVHDLSGGRIQWPAGKLYPIMHDLENKALVTTYWEASSSGPRRKYYTLTGQGRQALATAKRDWYELHAMLHTLWGPAPSLGVT